MIELALEDEGESTEGERPGSALWKLATLAIGDSAHSYPSDLEIIRTKSLPPPSSASDTEKELLRLFIAFNVLGKLGFSEGRILQCLREGVGEGETWEEALEWVIFIHQSKTIC